MSLRMPPTTLELLLCATDSSTVTRAAVLKQITRQGFDSADAEFAEAVLQHAEDAKVGMAVYPASMDWSFPVVSVRTSSAAEVCVAISLARHA